MNQYRIITGNSTYARTVIELNQKEAVKELKARFKADDRILKDSDIHSIELVAENVSATKEQERRAIEQIKEILATLGENSYLSIAMDGVLEDAENNIEYDFGDSYKSRYEHAEARYNALRIKRDFAEDKAREAQETIERQAQEIEALKKRIPATEDLEACMAIVSERKFEYDKQIRDAAQTIVEYADLTDSEEFQFAVITHRDAKRAYERNQGLMNRLINSIVGA